MENEMHLNLPEDLSPELQQFVEEHRAIVEATLQPYVEMKLVAQSNLTQWQSKLGGDPYLPKTVKYPKGKGGSPLQFLAQINFAEVPKLPNFPESGLLQFYIAGDDDLFGANFENLSDTKNFRVLYFPELETNEAELITDFGFMPEFDYSPLSGSIALQFEQKWMPISWGDYRFSDRIGNLFESINDDFRWEYADKVASGDGHRIGGYPGFTQTDPREFEERYHDYDCLLFQLDSETIYEGSHRKVELMWGDTGIANFFIKSEALKQLDFSDVLFNWDCC